jgi:Reverse transcriptase (RNA-dependent DNA polymerase)
MPKMMPHGKKLFGRRCVYAEKYDGTYRSNPVAQLVSQETGKDFTKSHSTVMTDLAFRLELIIKALKMFCTGHFDIETALLYSELNKGIYMMDTSSTC